MYTNKKILITGGSGSIGVHLLKRLLDQSPSVVRILSRDEYKQHNMQLQFQDHHKQLRFLIGDVRDSERVLRAMEDIDIVFHLAAMKHVPFCEYNPFEAVKTNVIGTQNVIQAAISAGVRKVLFTSSDKAISPTNTYGASKLMGERLISAAEYQKGSKQTTFSSVRFGNVMGSRGSVIPFFKKQILEQGYITVTDLAMTRYLMTPSQAISLIMEASEKSQGGEVFVLKMPIVRLSDLAEIVVEEVKRKHQIHAHIEIRETGLRPGEKMFEELMTDDETRLALEMKNMYVIPPAFKEILNTTTFGKGFSKTRIANEETPIEKETLRDWILSEQLI